jgi:hypothetical protein
MSLPLGFGTVPFGLYPFGIPPDPFAEEGPTVLHSSRKIDLIRGTVNIDDDGNAEGMDDIAQRVLLAVRQVRVPELQTRSFDEEMQQEIRRVLAEAELTIGSNPSIDLVRADGQKPVQIFPKPNGFQASISYRNNLTGTETVVTVVR